MLLPEDARNRAEQLVTIACKLGADAADVIVSGGESENVTIRLDSLEDVERSEDEAIGVRVFVGQQSASVSGSDFSKQALNQMAERALAMARHAPPDPYATLAPKDLLASGPFADFDLVDPQLPSPAELREYAQIAEQAGRAVSGVTNSNGASAGTGRSTMALATSEGFAGTYSASSVYYSAGLVAGEGEHMQRDYASHSARHFADLPPPEKIGEEAGARAVMRLNPGKMPSGNFSVVFEPRIGASLIGHLIGGMNGLSAARRSTFLLDHMGKSLFNPSITIIDDPHRLRGLRSRPFDGEGLPTSKRKLVDDGCVTGWLTNMASARQLGLEPTGHASRGDAGNPGVSVTNIHLEPGNSSVNELIHDIKDGVYITELIGQGVNGTTGDYSRGASGRRIRNGHLTDAVTDFTIAGNLLPMFANLSAANDLVHERGINVPTLRVDGMTIAGG